MCGVFKVLELPLSPPFQAAGFLEVYVTHVYNDQIDSVFTDPKIRKFGMKKWNV